MLENFSESFRNFLVILSNDGYNNHWERGTGLGQIIISARLDEKNKEIRRIFHAERERRNPSKIQTLAPTLKPWLWQSFGESLNSIECLKTSSFFPFFKTATCSCIFRYFRYRRKFECCSGHVEQSVDGGWRIAGAGDRRHRTLERSSW